MVVDGNGSEGKDGVVEISCCVTADSSAKVPGMGELLVSNVSLFLLSSNRSVVGGGVDLGVGVGVGVGVAVVGVGIGVLVGVDWDVERDRDGEGDGDGDLEEDLEDGGDVVAIVEDELLLFDTEGVGVPICERSRVADVDDPLRGLIGLLDRAFEPSREGPSFMPAIWLYFCFGWSSTTESKLVLFMVVVL